MKLTIEIKGVNELVRKLEAFGVSGQKAVADVTKFRALGIERDAKRDAPVDKGTLRQGIKAGKISDKKWAVVARAPYSAYMEFGTGTFVQVPQELYDIAIQFKGKGVREVNIPAQPYLYPAFLGAVKTYKNDLQDALRVEIDKIK